MAPSKLSATAVSRKLSMRVGKSFMLFSWQSILSKLIVSMAIGVFVLLLLSCQSNGKSSTAKPGPGLSDATRQQLEQPFLIVRNGDIFLVDAFGNEKQLTQAPIDRGAYIKDPARSPDGKKIVYSFTPPIQRTEGAVFAVSGAELWTINADGSDQRALLKDQDPAGRFEHAAWSPDGTSIFYTYYKPIYSEGKFVDTELSIEQLHLSTLTRTMVEKNAYYPSVSKDSRLMAFLHLSPDYAQSLMLKDLKGGSIKELIKGGDFSAISTPRFSPDSNTIAFVASGEYMPTAKQDADQKEEGRTFRFPKLFSVAEANGLPWDVWTIKTDGTGLDRITELSEDSPSMDWSNDGKYIAVLGIKGLFIAEVSGKRVASISNNGAFHGQLDWAF